MTDTALRPPRVKHTLVCRICVIDSGDAGSLHRKVVSKALPIGGNIRTAQFVAWKANIEISGPVAGRRGDIDSSRSRYSLALKEGTPRTRTPCLSECVLWVGFGPGVAMRSSIEPVTRLCYLRTCIQAV